MDVFPLGSDRCPQAVSAAVRGEIDLSCADDLLLRLLILAGPATGEITLDLSQVTFIDCAGLRALIALSHHVRAAGGRLRVTAISTRVDRLFELALPHGHELLASPTPPTSRHSDSADDTVTAGPTGGCSGVPATKRRLPANRNS